MSEGAQLIALGKEGRVHIGGLFVGRLTEWKLVMSPTTKMPTLIGSGSFRRYFLQGVGGRVSATITPAAVPHRIGRKRRPTPKPATIEGVLFRLTPTAITIASGTVTEQ